MIVGLKHIIFILGLGAILASNLLHAQGPDLWQVIGGAGFTGVSGDLTISATVGETAIGSGHEKLIDVDIFHYTEGFQQTDDYVPNPNLEVSTYSNQAQCPDVHDGTLDVFPTGCKDPYTITLAGNGDTIVVEDVSTAGHTFTALDSGEYQVTVRGVTLCAYSELARVDL